jgi:uncharacterized membrane protein
VQVSPGGGGPPEWHRWVLPSHEDPVVIAASRSIGGPVGRRAVIGVGWWTPLRVLVVLALVASVLGVVFHSPCRTSAWGDSVKVYTHGCYTDVVPLYTGRGLSQDVLPYFGDPTQVGAEPVEYPVLTGAVMWLTSIPVVRTWSIGKQALAYYDVNAAFDALLLVVVVWATALVARRRPWDAAMVAVAPGVILTATINWDLWAVALTALAVLLWARRYPFAAGLVLGLGVSAKFYPALLLLPVFLVCLRAGRMRPFVTVAAGAALSWFAVNLPVMLTHYDAWVRFYELSHDRGADYGSLWLVLAGQGVVDFSDIGRLNLWGEVAFVGLCLAVALLALMAPRRPRFAQLAFLVLAAFVLTNKVYSPQYVLWLIPLAVLARPRWRDFLLWQLVEVAYFFSVWWYIHSFTEPNRALPASSYYFFVALHLVALAAYAGMVVRDVLLPRHDPVRATDGDDPTGGPVEDAADRVTLGPWARRRREESRVLALPLVPTGAGSSEPS